MTRELKFRAWHKRRKKMYPVLSLHGGTLSNGGQWATCQGRNPVECQDINIQIQPKDAVIMQFTGLLDKNGKEIYEGDVIECEYHSGLPTTVGLDTLVWCGVVTWGCDASFHTRRIDSSGSYSVGYGGSAVKRWDVVGNIYDNPELLTV